LQWKWDGDGDGDKRTASAAGKTWKLKDKLSNGLGFGSMALLYGAESANYQMKDGCENRNWVSKVEIWPNKHFEDG